MNTKIDPKIAARNPDGHPVKELGLSLYRRASLPAALQFLAPGTSPWVITAAVVFVDKGARLYNAGFRDLQEMLEVLPSAIASLRDAAADSPDAAWRVVVTDDELAWAARAAKLPATVEMLDIDGLLQAVGKWLPKAAPEATAEFPH